MTLNSQVARPGPQELHIIALLSTERGRRSALFSSVQCLLSVVGSMGIILLFAGIPQLIYSPEVTLTNVVTFLMGALLLSVMVAGNACISYKFRAEIDEIRGVLREGQPPPPPIEDKPPSYDELTFGGDTLPPDYYAVVGDKLSRNDESSQVHEDDVAPIHRMISAPAVEESCIPSTTDMLPHLWLSQHTCVSVGEMDLSAPTLPDGAATLDINKQPNSYGTSCDSHLDMLSSDDSSRSRGNCSSNTDSSTFFSRSSNNGSAISNSTSLISPYVNNSCSDGTSIRRVLSDVSRSIVLPTCSEGSVQPSSPPHDGDDPCGRDPSGVATIVPSPQARRPSREGKASRSGFSQSEEIVRLV